MSHLDFWDPAFYSDPSLVVRIQGGHKNRFSTVFWYLSDCEGGETAFPRAPLHVPHVARSFDTSKDTCTSNATSEMIQNITKERDIASLRKECSNSVKIAPVKGKSIIFYSLLPDGRGDQLSEHSACEVVKGEKWAVNKWIWSANF
jgi:prolyl 4-hydroxylase